MKLKIITIFIISILLNIDLMANAIAVNNIAVDVSTQKVSFDLKWNNSWRVDSLYSPNNWDAAWVFVKFTECDSLNTTFSYNWEHGKIDTIIANNNFENLEPVLNNGNIGISDSLGVMLRRKTNGLFSDTSINHITLKVNNLDPSKSYHVRVVAIEMVYVTQGDFHTGWVSNQNSFDSIIINSENALTINTKASAPNNSISLSADFPKGYKGFHCMKYEISNNQYATFLNTISNTQATARYYNSISNRHNLTNTGIVQFEKYVSTRGDRAYNYLSWDDLLSYLDWAALKPMTELQYEKACRGLQNIVINEYSWGTTFINNGNEFSGIENGTENFIDATANCVYNNVAFLNGDGGKGPSRVGIFALPSNSTREQSGASFYGILDMSGNLFEYCVNVSSFTKVGGLTNFKGKNGDGDLDNNGLWNETFWPLTNKGSGMRGGAWTSGSTHCRIGSRVFFLDSGIRNLQKGGRGIR